MMDNNKKKLNNEGNEHKAKAAYGSINIISIFFLMFFHYIAHLCLLNSRHIL